MSSINYPFVLYLITSNVIFGMTTEPTEVPATPLKMKRITSSTNFCAPLPPSSMKVIRSRPVEEFHQKIVKLFSHEQLDDKSVLMLQFGYLQIISPKECAVALLLPPTIPPPSCPINLSHVFIATPEELITIKAKMRNNGYKFCCQSGNTMDEADQETIKNIFAAAAGLFAQKASPALLAWVRAAYDAK